MTTPLPSPPTVTAPSKATRVTSPLLRPGTELIPTADGYVLCTADEQYLKLGLDEAGTDLLLDALVTGTPPSDDRAAVALQALRDGGHLLPTGPSLAAPMHASVTIGLSGDATWLPALQRSLDTSTGPGGVRRVHALTNEPCETAPTDDALPGNVRKRSGADDPLEAADGGTLVCWGDGPRLVLAPRRVPAADAAARLRASRRRHRPRDVAGRRVTAAPTWSAAQQALAVAVVTTEVLRRGGPRPATVTREDLLLTVVDLRTAESTRHLVLPTPTLPR